MKCHKGFVGLLLGLMGVAAGVAAALVFGFHDAINSGVWAMVSAIYATAYTSLVYQTVYLKNRQRAKSRRDGSLINADTDDESSYFDGQDLNNIVGVRTSYRCGFIFLLFLLGVFGAIAAVGGFGFYVTRAALDGDGISINSDWVVPVWCFMTVKWSSVLAWQVKFQFDLFQILTITNLHYPLVLSHDDPSKDIHLKDSI